MTEIEAYPWVVPTEEQKAMFDNLSSEQQLDILRKVFIHQRRRKWATELLDMEKICQRSRQKAGLLPCEEKP